MPLSPQRPFVPQPTTTSPQSRPRTTGFHLLPPFLHGQAVAAAATLPSISEFLEVQPSTSGSGLDFAAETAEENYELPPVEHFMDPLPASPDLDEAGWEDSGWQQFDWDSAASLGDTPDPEATDAWSRTEWDTTAAQNNERETPAQAIASALDQIAQRIRHGEIVVPPADLVRDPAAIAATLAALLGVRR